MSISEATAQHIAPPDLLDAEQAPSVVMSEQIHDESHPNIQEFHGTVEQAMRLCPALGKMSREGAQKALDEQAMLDKMMDEFEAELAAEESSMQTEPKAETQPKPEVKHKVEKETVENEPTTIEQLPNDVAAAQEPEVRNAQPEIPSRVAMIREVIERLHQPQETKPPVKVAPEQVESQLLEPSQAPEATLVSDAIVPTKGDAMLEVEPAVLPTGITTVEEVEALNIQPVDIAIEEIDTLVESLSDDASNKVSNTDFTETPSESVTPEESAINELQQFSDSLPELALLLDSEPRPIELHEDSFTNDETESAMPLDQSEDVPVESEYLTVSAELDATIIELVDAILLLEAEGEELESAYPATFEGQEESVQIKPQEKIQELVAKLVELEAKIQVSDTLSTAIDKDALLQILEQLITDDDDAGFLSKRLGTSEFLARVRQSLVDYQNAAVSAYRLGSSLLHLYSLQ